MVWKSRDIKAEWDGSYGGGIVPEAPIWKASYKEKNNDGKKRQDILMSSKKIVLMKTIHLYTCKCNYIFVLMY